MSAAEGILQTLEAQDELKRSGCTNFDCEYLTICDLCGQFVCAEHTEDVVDCPDGPTHHADCADQCTFCSLARAEDAAAEAATEAWKERDL